MAVLTLHAVSRHGNWLALTLSDWHTVSTARTTCSYRKTPRSTATLGRRRSSNRRRKDYETVAKPSKAITCWIPALTESIHPEGVLKDHALCYREHWHIGLLFFDNDRHSVGGCLVYIPLMSAHGCCIWLLRSSPHNLDQTSWRQCDISFLCGVIWNIGKYNTGQILTRHDQ